MTEYEHQIATKVWIMSHYHYELWYGYSLN